jgi:adenosine deaminase
MNILVGITDNKDILFLEAYLLLKKNDIYLDEINVIKTKNTKREKKITQYFEKNEIEYWITDGSEISMLESEEDYNKVEEFFFSWYSTIRNKSKNIFVFVGGGHKLHALALQKSASLFGANKVFHIFYDGARGTEPKTFENVTKAIKENKLLLASLGGERGWPSLLDIHIDNPHEYRNKIQSIIDSIASRNANDVNELPFECLNLLPQAAINWLNQPLENDDFNWVLSLPKTELHCHLGGFATCEPLLEKVRQNALYELQEKKNIEYPEKWPLPDIPISLDEYMKLGDNNGSYILNDEGCLVKQIELLYINFIEQNVNYAEVRCSPFNYESNKNSGKDILDIIINTFNDLMRKYKNKCHVNIIIIATRNKSSKYIERNLDLAVNYEHNSDKLGACQVVGGDLAGYENKETRAKYYESNFEIVHRKGLDITIHAGENDDSEGIWQAIYKLNTRRIGHGLNLYQDKNLIRSVINRKIGVEMCPYANYQIVGFKPMKRKTKNYPLSDYLQHGIQICINTDNIGISDANITDNFMLLIQLNPGITRMQVLSLVRNGMLQAFVGYKFRLQMLKEFNSKIFNILLNKNFL